MNDSQSASLVMLAGAGALAYWWWHLTRGDLSAGNTPEATETPGTGLPVKRVNVVTPNLENLRKFAAEWHLRETSGYRPGANSLHGEGRAIDVSPPPANLVDAIKKAAADVGIHIFPEHKGQVGANGSVSTGEHLHLSFPEYRNGRLVF